MRSCWVFLPVAVLMAGSACAEPSRITQTTWMRSQPRETAPIIDEIATGIRVSVLRCASGWCEIDYARARGYVRQALLAEAPPTPSPPASHGCFAAERYTPHGPLALTVCP